jgi:hypothetical protein
MILRPCARTTLLLAALAGGLALAATPAEPSPERGRYEKEELTP